MPKSVNKVLLVGNVGKDPEVKYSPSGTPMAKFSLATNETFKAAAASGRSASNGTALSPGNDLRRLSASSFTTGSKVYIEGKLQTSNWEDRRSGERRYRTEIVAREIVLLGSRVNGQEGKGEVPGAESSPESAPAETEDSVPF